MMPTTTTPLRKPLEGERRKKIPGSTNINLKWPARKKRQSSIKLRKQRQKLLESLNYKRKWKRPATRDPNLMNSGPNELQSKKSAIFARKIKQLPRRRD